MPKFLSRPKKAPAAAAAGLLLFMALNAAPAQAGREEYVGEVILFAGSYCPNGTLPADGQLLQLNDDQILYSLLQNTYGGTAGQNFNLPNLSAPVAGMRYCIVTNGDYPERPN